MAVNGSSSATKSLHNKTESTPPSKVCKITIIVRLKCKKGTEDQEKNAKLDS